MTSRLGARVARSACDQETDMKKFVLAAAALAARCPTAMAHDAKQAPEGSDSLPRETT